MDKEKQSEREEIRRDKKEVKDYNDPNIYKKLLLKESSLNSKSNIENLGLVPGLESLDEGATNLIFPEDEKSEDK